MNEAKKQKIQKWELLVQERLDSGLQVSEFCEIKGFTENMYYHWVNAIHKADPDFDTRGHSGSHGEAVNSFVEIKPEKCAQAVEALPSDSEACGSAPAAVIRSGAVEIELLSTADTPFMRKLLEAVRYA